MVLGHYVMVAEHPGSGARQVGLWLGYSIAVLSN